MPNDDHPEAADCFYIDPECPRFGCRKYREGWWDGYEIARAQALAEGYENGHADGLAEGYEAGLGDGAAASQSSG